MWHPLSTAEIYDLSRALQQPRVLDATPREDPWTRATGVTEISGACFAGQDVVISTSADEPDTADPGHLGPCMLARWSTRQQKFSWSRRLAQTAGDLLTIGNGILALHQCPRLYDSATGELQAEWPGLDTGQADSSIVWGKAFSGPARSRRRTRETVRGHRRRENHRHPARLTARYRPHRSHHQDVLIAGGAGQRTLEPGYQMRVSRLMHARLCDG